MQWLILSYGLEKVTCNHHQKLYNIYDEQAKDRRSYCKKDEQRAGPNAAQQSSKFTFPWGELKSNSTPVSISMCTGSEKLNDATSHYLALQKALN